MRDTRKRYIILLIGSLLGLGASFLQTIEKIALVSGNSALPCDLNSIFSCSVVLRAPQSSLFGFPNSLMCMVLFSMFTMFAITGLSVQRTNKRLNAVMLGVISFFLLFALWFLYTSIFTIGAICLFCLVCFVGLLCIIGSLTRIVTQGMKHENAFSRFVSRGYDMLVWASLALIVAVMVISKFYMN